MSDETAAAEQFLTDHGINRVQVFGVHHDSLLVGKVLSPATFLRSIGGGFGIGLGSR